MADTQPARGGTLGEGLTRPGPGGALAALGARATSDRMWAMALEGVPFGFAILDRDLRYVHVNRFLADVNGCAVADHIGRTLPEIATGVASIVEPAVRQVLDTGETVADVAFTHPDPDAPGRTRHRLGSYHPVRDDGGTVVGVCAVVVDVTERRRAAEALTGYARRQAAVADLGQRALTHSDVDALLADAVGVVERTLGVGHVAVLESSRDQSSLTLRAGVGWPQDLKVLDADDDEGGNVFGFALAAAAPVTIDDLGSDPVFAGAPKLVEHGLTSAAVVVIRGEQAPFGLLGAFTRGRGRFGDDDLTFLQSVANIVGSAVEQRRAAEGLRNTAEQLQFALEAGDLGYWEWAIAEDTISWSPTLEAIIGVPDPRGARTFADYLAIVHPEDRAATAVLTRAAIDGQSDGTFEHRIVRADGAVRWLHGVAHVQRDGEGQAVRMVGLSADITERKEAEQARVRALAAERAARAEAEAAGKRLAFLAEATARMTASLDHPSTVQAVARLVVPVFADVCIVRLTAGDEEPLVAIAARDPDTEALVRGLMRRCARAEPANNPLATVGRTGRSVLSAVVPRRLWEEFAVDAAHLRQLTSLRISTGMCVPLTVRGTTIGTVALGRQGPATPYGDTDLVLAEELARRAALAIDNARLFEEVQRTGERSRRLAETLQRSLLPPRLPVVPRCELAAAYHAAAREAGVGGDFYDVFPLGGGRWGIVIGDVCGKGAEAAALTALARYTIRTVALIEEAPTAVLAALNGAILREAGEAQYCTVAFATLCPRSGELRLVCGGHPLPLVRRATGTVERVGVPGTLIGLLEEADVTESAISLAPGDSILFFTDGVVDARTADRGSDVFGEERLAKSLRVDGGSGAEATVQRVESRVLDFSGGQVRDDLALLALRMLDGSTTGDPGTLR